jgi:hypothetical protein
LLRRTQLRKRTRERQSQGWWQIRKKALAGESGISQNELRILQGNGYKIWHKGRSTFFDHKHPPHYAPHKMFHGVQTHHKPHGKGENYHRKDHTSVAPQPLDKK